MNIFRDIQFICIPGVPDKVALVQGSGGEDPGDAAQQLEDGQQ